MTYKQEFGRELKRRLDNKEATELIGEWAHSTYIDHIQDIDNAFRDILLTLNYMSLGTEFAYSYEELNQIANALIESKEVKL